MTLNQSDFELLLQANRILASKIDIAEVLETVMELATKVVKAEVSSLLLLDEKKNELYFDVALGEHQNSVKQIRIKMGEGIAGWTAQKREPLIVNEVSKDPRFTGKVDKSTKFQTKSIMAVPLILKDKLVGVVEAINKENDGQFSLQDQEIFSAFASQSAIAIENARLFFEVKREKEKLNTIFTEMSDGVVFLDGEQNIIVLNKTAGRLLNLNVTESIGRRFDQNLLQDYEIPPQLNNLKEQGQDLSVFEIIRKKGKHLFISANFHTLPATREVPEGGALLLLRDETEEKQGEFLKRNFLSLVSHKLKTPLTVILGYGPALISQMDGLSDFQKKALPIVYRQGQLLGGLVDKLLRFTLLESETLKLDMKHEDIAPLIRTAADEMIKIFQEKKILMEVDPGIASMPKVDVDSSLMSEVIKNLIENSIKFNDNDEISIKISGLVAEGKVQIVIEDNGVGIPSEEIDKVFKKFYQIENSFTGQVPGAGLGLSFCKKIIEEMGGKIELISTLGKGTTAKIDVLKA